MIRVPFALSFLQSKVKGERITSMVERTGAVAGVNGGGFNDPDGLGNGFAPIGAIMSGGNILYTDQEGSMPNKLLDSPKKARSLSVNTRSTTC